MKPGRLIGKGRTAEVYEWDEGWVLKLFYPHIPRGWVSYEAKVGSLVFDAGAPAPRVGGCVELGDRAGIIYEESVDNPIGASTGKAPRTDTPSRWQPSTTDPLFNL